LIFSIQVFNFIRMQMKSLIFEVCAYVFHYIRLKMENCKFLLVNDGLWLNNEMIFFYQAVEFAYTTVVQTNMVDKQNNAQ
jgi:type IV secretory pathway VirB4 component